MATWLKADLRASKLPWRIVVLHHPPYTHGSHDSDSPTDSGGRMIALRKNILPILERNGVDLVLSGHSHMYERTHAIACHYQTSDHWQEKFIRDATSPYSKNRGTVYMVVGSSSKLDNGPLDHPANTVALHEPGSLLIDINDKTLESRFITRQGQIGDQFKIVMQPNQVTGAGPNCE
jgi:3',5'-cyclic AMP phosphodiesterase CpdA